MVEVSNTYNIIIPSTNYEYRRVYVEDMRSLLIWLRPTGSHSIHIEKSGLIHVSVVEKHDV